MIKQWVPQWKQWELWKIYSAKKYWNIITILRISIWFNITCVAAICLPFYVSCKPEHRKNDGNHKWKLHHNSNSEKKTSRKNLNAQQWCDYIVKMNSPTDSLIKEIQSKKKPQSQQNVYIHWFFSHAFGFSVA